MDEFPAILIGGPPHSGKSILVYCLTQALRQARIAHYVLPACPDGEGDWSHEADQGLVQVIRAKGKFNETFVKRTTQALQERQSPLLVDVGGRPTAEQQKMFGFCSHAILLIREDAAAAETYRQDETAWREMLAQQNVPLIALLKSHLHGQQELISTEPLLTGVISGLERGNKVEGVLIDALVEKVSTLFTFSEAELAAIHLPQAPVELTLDLPQLARTLGSPDGRWQPSQLPALQAYLPERVPLALYGRGPIWLYAMLALQAYPAPIWLFNPRNGWITPPQLPLQADDRQNDQQSGWQAQLEEHKTYTLLTLKTHSQLLDIDQPQRLPLPQPPAGKGLILSGKIPHWIATAVVRQLVDDTPWLAVYQPSIGGAVVIFSRDLGKKMGQILSIDN